MKMAFAVLGALALAASSAASATDYVVTFDSDAGAFSGTFTTTPDPNPNFVLVTGLTGTLGGNALTLLPVLSYAGNDNLFSPTSPFFTSDGLSFSAAGSSYNLYNSGSGTSLCTGPTICVGSLVRNFSVQGARSVPEPGTWAMMLLGFGAIGFQIRRSQGRRTQPA